MPHSPNDFETSQNRVADPFAGASKGGNLEESSLADDASELEDRDWLQIATQSKSAAESYMGPLKSTWSENYNAFRNEHSNKSMYLSARWKGRSKLHRPKTRAAVHKADSKFAASLFATSEVVAIEATNALNPQAVASAEIKGELLGYRLDRKSGKAGVPWFQIACGASNDARLTGLIISKQFWEYRQIKSRTDKEPKLAIGKNGLPKISEVAKTKVIRDRPMIQLFPAELVLRDPGANWLDQAQDSSFIGLMYPMTIGDIEALIRNRPDKTTSMKWRKGVTRAQLLGARIPMDTLSVRSAREGNTADRLEQTNAVGQEFNRSWLIEWFIRYRGEEWHFWTAGTNVMLSDAVPLEQAYPEYSGERPIVIGVAAIEPHNITPMAPVSSTMPLQDEMNSLVNLRIDSLKEAIRPLTMVKKGSLTDITAIQNRSGDSAVYVNDPQTDVVFDRPPGPSQESYMEMAHLNADFDSVFGQFDGGSVSTNRSLNETVGGLNLLNETANDVGDYDTRILIETWVEPVLRQVVRLEEFYEDDKIILALAGKKAKLFQKFGIDKITDELLDHEVSVTVSAGIGSTNPLKQLSKFQQAVMIAAGALGPEIQMRMKQDAVINEVFGSAGFKDASERFFHEGDGNTDPRLTKMKQALQEAQTQLDDKQADRDNKIEQKRIDVAGEIVVQILQGEMKAQEALVAHQQALEAGQMQHGQDMEKDAAGGERDMAQAEMSAASQPKGEGKGKMAPPITDPRQQAFAQQIMQSLFPIDQAPVQGGGDEMMGQAIQQMAAQSEQQMSALMMMMQQLTRAVTALGQGMNAMVDATLAPKRVIMGRDGMPIGVVPMSPGEGDPGFAVNGGRGPGFGPPMGGYPSTPPIPAGMAPPPQMGGMGPPGMDEMEMEDPGMEDPGMEEPDMGPPPPLMQ